MAFTQMRLPGMSLSHLPVTEKALRARLGISRDRGERDGWERETAGASREVQRQKGQGQTEQTGCHVVTWQLCARQLGSEGPGSADLTLLGEWRGNSIRTVFLA